MEIPIMYQVMSDKFYDSSIQGRIEMKKANQIITRTFRMPKFKRTSIIQEMKKMGLIKIDNCRFLLINRI